MAADPETSNLHFPADVDEEYFKQLTAEKRVTKFVRGRPSMVWKQIRDRNESLDTMVYGFAAIYILNPNFELLEEKILTGETRPPEPRKKQRLPINRSKGNFANNWK